MSKNPYCGFEGCKECNEYCCFCHRCKLKECMLCPLNEDKIDEIFNEYFKIAQNIKIKILDNEKVSE